MLDNLYIFVINLKKRVDRLQNIKKELEKTELINKDNIIIINAIDSEYAKKEKFNFITEIAYRNILYGDSTTILPTWGSVGCAMSHMKCWDLIVEKYADNDDNLFLILEDDLEIKDIIKFNFKLMSAYFIYKKNKKGLLKEILNEYKYSSNKNLSNQPLLLLFESNTSNNSVLPFFNDLYSVNGDFRGTHCYMINKEFIFSNKESLIPFTYQFDIQLSQIDNYLLYNNDYYNHIYDIYNFKKSKILNLKNAGIIQSKKFSSDVQVFKPSINFLKKTFYLPLDACSIIYNYLNYN